MNSDMPLVACVSQGGPYDDESYLAGWELGQISEILSHRPSAVALAIRAENLRQADLLAMGYGYSLWPYRFDGGIVHVEFKWGTSVED